jgi:hypothetical protein
MHSCITPLIPFQCIHILSLYFSILAFATTVFYLNHTYSTTSYSSISVYFPLHLCKIPIDFAHIEITDILSITL